MFKGVKIKELGGGSKKEIFGPRSNTAVVTTSTTSMGETKLLKILKRKGKTHGTVKVLARSILYKHSNLGSLETFDSTIRSLIEKKQLYVMHKLGARGVQYAWTKGGNEIIPDGFFSSELADNTGDLIP